MSEDDDAYDYERHEQALKAFGWTMEDHMQACSHGWRIFQGRSGGLFLNKTRLDRRNSAYEAFVCTPDDVMCKLKALWLWEHFNETEREDVELWIQKISQRGCDSTSQHS